ncbi:hypothetical protein [Polyangium jinanense]|uniref:STAS/SEC14 domain-containing protein n=1 Tax=Polyangium jinanense TaxID=2829994 RepID=A0A9X3X9L7_9BACT|nr:hypothetical protein [Polyangium jinanense]MDC3959051.1 hypothetical protein [Polyangium jinanense]MDC3984026.1 hypothetical protein [Polyangium jinanense]
MIVPPENGKPPPDGGIVTPDTHTAGEHRIEREETDLFVYRFTRGTATGAHVGELSKLEKPLWDECAPIYNLVVLGEDLSIAPGAITETAKLFRASPPRTAAYVVRRFFHRTSMEFLTRMIRAFGVNMYGKVFDNEASARAWLAERRRGRNRKSVM